MLCGKQCARVRARRRCRKRYRRRRDGSRLPSAPNFLRRRDQGDRNERQSRSLLFSEPDRSRRECRRHWQLELRDEQHQSRARPRTRYRGGALLGVDPHLRCGFCARRRCSISASTDESADKSLAADLSGNGNDRYTRVAGAIVVTQPRKSIVFEVALAHNDQQRFSARAASRGSFPANVVVTRKLSVRVIAIGRSGKRNRDLSLRRRHLRSRHTSIR